MNDPVHRDLSALVHLWAGPTTAVVALLIMWTLVSHSMQQRLVVLLGCLIVFGLRYRRVRDGAFSASVGLVLWVPLGRYMFFLGQATAISLGRTQQPSAAYFALLRSIPGVVVNALEVVMLAAIVADVAFGLALPRFGFRSAGRCVARFKGWSEVYSMFSWLVVLWFALLSVALTPPLFLVTGFAAFTGQASLTWFFALTSTVMISYVVGALFAIRALTRGEWQRFRLAVANAHQTTGDMSRA